MHFFFFFFLFFSLFLSLFSFFLFSAFKKTLIWLHRVLFAACDIFLASHGIFLLWYRDQSAWAQSFCRVGLAAAQKVSSEFPDQGLNPRPLHCGPDFFFFDSSVGKESTCNAGDPGSIPWVGKIRWRRDRLPTPVFLGFPDGSARKDSAFNLGGLGLILGLGRSPGEGKGYPLQYSGLENSMD